MVLIAGLGRFVLTFVLALAWFRHATGNKPMLKNASNVAFERSMDECWYVVDVIRTKPWVHSFVVKFPYGLSLYCTTEMRPVDEVNVRIVNGTRLDFIL